MRNKFEKKFGYGLVLNEENLSYEDICKEL